MDDSPSIFDPTPPGADSRTTAPLVVKLGDFTLLRLLGAGANGRVYEARHLATGRRVAVKTVEVASPNQCSFLRREIHALRRIRHRGVIRILDAGLADGTPWYAMELLDGETLADAVVRAVATRPPEGRRAPLLPISQVLALGIELASALCALDERGLLHGDLKPSNILLRGPTEPVLVDFGFAEQIPGPGQRAGLETPLGVAGTPCYLAPERLLGAAPDPRTDLYALGCVLHELIVGEPPFSPAQIERLWIDAQPPPRIRERVPSVPPRLDDLIASLIHPQRADRPARAEDVLDALLGCSESSPPRKHGKGSPRLQRSSLVGRGPTLTALLDAASGAEDGKGGLVIITGASGIGKSHLAAVWLQRMVGRFHVVVGQAPSLDAGTSGAGSMPLQAFRPFLADVADRCREHDSFETERLLGSGRATQLAAFAPELLPFAPTALERSEAPAGPAVREKLIRALRELIEASAAPEPLAIVLDDLQWCDELTLGFLDALPADWLAARPILILGLLRSEEESPALRSFLTRNDVRVLSLDPLSPSALEQLVREVAGLEFVPPALGPFLAERSGGNPLHATEVLAAVLSSGWLERVSPGRLQLPDGREPDASALAALPIPDSLSALLDRRLTALTGDSQRLLDAAAVLGRRFDDETLACVAGLTEEAALDATATLFAAQVLDAEADGRLRFSHDQLAARAYERLADAERRQLHARTAELLSERARTATDAGSLATSIGHHWIGAGEEHRAVAALAAGAEYAMRRSAFADAHRQWLRAVAICDADLENRRSTEDTVRYLLDAAGAAAALGEAATVERLVRDALVRLGSPCPSNETGWIGRAAADFARLMVRRWVSSSRPAAKDRERLWLVARASDDLVQARFFSDDLAAVVGASIRAIHCAERIGDPTAVLRSYLTMATLAGSLRLRGLSEDWFERARLVAETRGDEVEAALSLAGRAVHLLGEGELGKAREAVMEAAVCIEDGGDASIHEIVLTTRGHVAHYRADYADAIAAYQHVLASGRARGNEQIQAWGLFSLARSLLPCGRSAEARDHLEEAARILDRRPELQSEVICFGLLALARQQTGDGDAARKAVRHTMLLLTRARQAGFPSAFGLGALADVLVPWTAAGDREAARWLRRVLRLFARLRVLSPVTRPAFAVAAGGRANAIGRRARARRHFLHGARLAERLGLPLDRARALGGLATLAPANSPERVHLRGEAKAILDAIGAARAALPEECWR